jgi:hypothetical protein
MINDIKKHWRSYIIIILLLLNLWFENRELTSIFWNIDNFRWEIAKVDYTCRYL